MYFITYNTFCVYFIMLLPQATIHQSAKPYAFVATFFLYHQTQLHDLNNEHWKQEHNNYKTYAKKHTKRASNQMFIYKERG
jgi:hypothetical protein